MAETYICKIDADPPSHAQILLDAAAQCPGAQVVSPPVTGPQCQRVGYPQFAAHVPALAVVNVMHEFCCHGQICGISLASIRLHCQGDGVDQGLGN